MQYLYSRSNITNTVYFFFLRWLHYFIKLVYTATTYYKSVPTFVIYLHAKGHLHG